MLKCAATCLLAVLSLQAVAATLSAEDKLLQANSEIARLQKLLETKQEAVEALAVSRAARAAGAQAPQFKTVQGSLEFQVKDGKRIGYKIGAADTVDFESLAKTDTQLGLLIQSVHKSGEATGEHAASIEYLKAESAYLKTNMSIAVFDAKLGSAVAPLNTRVASVEEKLKSMAAQAAASAQKKETSYWFDMFVEAGEVVGTTTVGPQTPGTLNIVGVGFDERFNPEAGNQFKCEYNDGKSKKTAFGSVAKASNYYTVQCAFPGYAKDSTIEVKLYEHTGTEVPFLGGAGSNKVKSISRFTKVILVSKYPKAPEFNVEGAFEKGKVYKCTWKGDRGDHSNTVLADSATLLQCGNGPTKVISSDVKGGKGTATLVITQGSSNIPGTPTASKVTYYACANLNSDFMLDCDTGCALDGSAARGGQASFTSVGTHKWTPNFCGHVSVMAIGGGCGGGWQWSSGGGGGGGLGWIKKFKVEKGKQYTIVVGKGGDCVANAGNTHSSDGGNSYFVSSNTVQGYGGGKGGPGAVSSAAGYGGGYKGDGGGRGGTGGRGTWHGGGGGAGGYKGRGGEATGNSCSNYNDNHCKGVGGGGGGAGHYSSSHGCPAGGGVGLNGEGTSGRGHQSYGGEGGSGGQRGSHGEPYSNGQGRCVRYGGKYGGGGPGSGTSHRGSGGKGGIGAVRIIWGEGRQYPKGGGNV